MKSLLTVFVLTFLLLAIFFGTTLAEKKVVKERTDFHLARVIMEIDRTAYSILAEAEIKLWTWESRGEPFFMSIRITPETEIRMRGEIITITELGELNGKEVQIWGRIEVLYQEGKEKKYSWITMNVVPVYPKNKKEPHLSVPVFHQ